MLIFLFLVEASWSKTQDIDKRSSIKHYVNELQNETESNYIKNNKNGLTPYNNTNVYPINPYTPYPTPCIPAKIDNQIRKPRPKYIIGGVILTSI